LYSFFTNSKQVLTLVHKFKMRTVFFKEEHDPERPAPALISITPATPLTSHSRDSILPEAEPQEKKDSRTPMQLSQSWTVLGQQQNGSVDGETGRHAFSKSDSQLAALQPAARVL
jgi:hypothetical protein